MKKILVLLCFSLLSCAGQEKNQILLEDYMTFYSDIKNRRLDFESPNLYLFHKLDKKESNRTIIKLINTECVSCYQDMLGWEEFLENNKFLENQRVVFIAQGSMNDYFKNEVSRKQYPFEIWMDTTSSFLYSNNLSSSYQFETFIIDKDSSVLMVGSPLADGEIVGHLFKYLTQEN